MCKYWIWITHNIDQVSGTMHCRTEAQGAAVKQINACTQVKTTVWDHSEAGTSAAAPGATQALGRSSGPGQIPKGKKWRHWELLCVEMRGTPCFSSVSQKDGQWPAGTPFSARGWRQQLTHGRSAELWGNTRWCQEPCRIYNYTPPAAFHLRFIHVCSVSGWIGFNASHHQQQVLPASYLKS